MDKTENSTDDIYKALVLSVSSYRRLAYRYQEVSGNTWDAKSAVDNLISQVKSKSIAEALSLEVTQSAREITLRRRSDRVRIGIASMPGREHGLSVVLERLAPQADEILVYLNNVESVGEGYPEYDNVRYFTGPDLGDRGKFQFLDNYNGYYLTCDDDIEYPKNYVQRIISGIEKYGRKAVVGWHGSLFKDPFTKFYDPGSRQVLSFSSLRGVDTPVHIVGTGISGFHTDTVSVHPGLFLTPNMADVYLGIYCQQRSIPMIVLAHDRNEATPIDRDAPAISTVSMGKASGNHMDVGTKVTQLVQEHWPWAINSCEPTRTLGHRIAFVGRTDKARWKKGGILKSAHLTKEMLVAHGHDVRLFDIELSLPSEIDAFDPECVIIYVGDPERPDFANVESLVRHHARHGRPVLINLSLNLMESRKRFIQGKMSEYKSLYGDLVSLMVFTNSSADIFAGSETVTLSRLFPKSLETVRPVQKSFRERSGIFIGDIGKLANSELLAGEAEQWISAIRRAAPNAPIYAVEQYRPARSLNLDIDEVWPFLRGSDFDERIGSVRLMVTPVKYATFEMVPLEAAALGVPVIHSHMPQSLSEYFGGTSIEAETPNEAAHAIEALYSNELLWTSFSKSIAENARSKRMQNMSAQMSLQIESMIKSANNRMNNA